MSVLFIKEMTMSNSFLTKEQAFIVDCDFEDILLINAYAGTGKTSTLVQFCEKRNRHKILYLSYNSSMRIEAEAKFKHIKNVSVKTMHSLAYENTDKSIKERLGSLRAMDLNIFVDDIQEKERNIYARILLSLLRNFCNTELDLKSFLQNISQNPLEYRLGKNINKAYILQKFEKLWNDELINNKTLAYEHDFYLKSFQLKKPILEYDFIVVDEAQDINGCVIDIVLNQKAKKVFIGDTYQSIYKFRGACNSLELLAKKPNVKILYLTQSFRCPIKIAKEANRYLQILNATKEFKGTFKENSSNTKTNSPKAIITRTNAKLFDIAVQNLDKKLFLVGGVQSYNFDDLLDIQKLLCKKKECIKNDFIKKFADVKELIEYCDESNEFDLKQKLLICFKYINENIFDLIKQIHSSVVKDPNKAELILSTGHKSKGLEWDKVEIIDDFINIREELEQKSELSIDKEEIHLFYVALTRCKNELFIDKKYLLDDEFLTLYKNKITIN